MTCSGTPDPEAALWPGSERQGGAGSGTARPGMAWHGAEADPRPGPPPPASGPATPEGGELDDLLRRADYWGQQVPRIGPTTADVFDVMARLASALRSQREQLTDERRRVEAFRTAANVSHASVVKLERELAEVRDTPRGEVLFEGEVSDWALLDGDRRYVALEGRNVGDYENPNLWPKRVVVRAAEDKETPT
jgi:hypothetical protein